MVVLGVRALVGVAFVGVGGWGRAVMVGMAPASRAIMIGVIVFSPEAMCGVPGSASVLGGASLGLVVVGGISVRSGAVDGLGFGLSFGFLGGQGSLGVTIFGGTC